MTREQIQADLTAALKSGEKVKVGVLRLLLSELNYRQIELQRELTEEEMLGVVVKEVKKRREAIESYMAGGRKELAAQEEAEMQVLLAYLPQMLTEEEVRQEVREKLKEMESRELGPVMKALVGEFKGRAEGRVVAKVVQELLARQGKN